MKRCGCRSARYTCRAQASFPSCSDFCSAFWRCCSRAVEGSAIVSHDTPAPTEWRRVICLATSVLAAAWLFERAGFVLTMAAFLTVTTAVLGKIAWWRSALMAVVGSAIAWVVFVRVLKIALPSGIMLM
jgi:Tripartite tricarboxylate transporter TctB family